jgi:hypothetical protein
VPRRRGGVKKSSDRPKTEAIWKSKCENLHRGYFKLFGVSSFRFRFSIILRVTVMDFSFYNILKT